MNDYEQKLEQKKSRVLVENNAQAIFDHLTELANLGGIHERRWLWELLQNAKDSVDESRTVSVEVAESISDFDTKERRSLLEPPFF